MNWTNAPIGAIRREELLGTLDSLAVTAVRANRGANPEYMDGFLNGLEAVARAHGLGEYLRPGPVIEVSKRIEGEL